jgi:pimeloyl-ACP methyl ester carboxylesterase
LEGLEQKPINFPLAPTRGVAQHQLLDEVKQVGLKRECHTGTARSETLDWEDLSGFFRFPPNTNYKFLGGFLRFFTPALVFRMKFDYGTVIHALRQEAQTQAALTPLRDDRCQPLFFCHSQPTQQVFLFFHGFTAAPYQLQSLGQALFQGHQNVLVPLLPGHGLQGDWHCETPPPLPLHRRVYEEFALRWLKRTRILGKKLVLGGIGTGATLAAWLASQYPKICDRLILLDPYLPVEPLTPYQLFTLSCQNLQGEEYWQWMIPPQSESLPGYEGFNVRPLVVWFELAMELWHRSQSSVLPPLLVVGSERERALGEDRSRLFCEQVRRQQPQAWHLYYSSVLDLNYHLLTVLHPEEVESLAQLVQQYTSLTVNAMSLMAV